MFFMYIFSSHLIILFIYIYITLLYVTFNNFREIYQNSILILIIIDFKTVKQAKVLITKINYMLFAINFL